MSDHRPRPLTAIVPTTAHWHHVERVVEALLPAITDHGIEVIAVCGAPDGPAPADREGLRYLAIDELDLFMARATAVSAAVGEVVAVLEDHAMPDSGWAAAVIGAWRDRPDIDAIVHAIAINPVAGAWEVAQFTMTFGPFMAVTTVPTDRTPVPGTVSFRRSMLPSAALTSGWIEYELLAPLIANGRVAMNSAANLVHIQPETWRAPVLAFYSGRMYAGSIAGSRQTAARQVRRVVLETRVVVDQSLAARRRTAGGLIGRRFALCFTCLVVAHVAGQIAAIVTGSVGKSPARLQ